MAGVEYDLQGRLQSFYAVPPQRERESGPSPAPDWAPLFAEARLDTSTVPPGRAAVDATPLLRRARRLGGLLAAPARDHPARGGRRLPRPARVVRDREPLDPSRARAGLPVHLGPTGDAVLLRARDGRARGRRRPPGLPQHPPRPRRSARRLPAGPRPRDPGRGLLGPARPPRARAGGRARPLRPRGGHRGPGGGPPLALLPRPRALRPPPPAVDARLLGPPARGRGARRGGGPRRPHRPGVGHRAGPPRRPRPRAHRVAGATGAAARGSRGRRAPLDAPAPELRRRSARERDPRRAGSPAALPGLEARDPPGPGRRCSRRGVPGLRGPGRLEGERLAAAALRDRGLGAPSSR